MKNMIVLLLLKKKSSLDSMVGQNVQSGLLFIAALC